MSEVSLEMLNKLTSIINDKIKIVRIEEFPKYEINIDSLDPQKIRAYQIEYESELSSKEINETFYKVEKLLSTELIWEESIKMV